MDEMGAVRRRTRNYRARIRPNERIEWLERPVVVEKRGWFLSLFCVKGRVPCGGDSASS
jgi:hypothetical protein